MLANYIYLGSLLFLLNNLRAYYITGQTAALHSIPFHMGTQLIKLVS